MRHVIVVVGGREQRQLKHPEIRLLDDEKVQYSTWYACSDQEKPVGLYDDERSFVARFFKAPFLAYSVYLLASNTRLWAKKRPLVFVRGATRASRLAARFASWGGGDVTQLHDDEAGLLKQTRYTIREDGSLEMRG